MFEYDYLVVGAGLTGCVFAHEMTKRGKKVLVVDRRSYVGGNCHSVKMNGIDVHEHGAHIFRTNDIETVRYLEQFTELTPFVNTPIAINGDVSLNLPLNMNTFAKLWGVITPAQARAKLDEVTEPYKRREIKSIEDFVLATVGKELFELVFKDYTEKQWGHKCSELPKELMSYIPIRLTYDNSYFNEKYTFVPSDGYESMFDSMLKGVDVYLNCNALATPSVFAMAKKVVYTGRIDEFFECCYGPLEYRSLLLEHKVLPDVNDFQGVAVTNHTGSDVPFTRIIEHSHFVKASPVGGTVITYETPIPYTGKTEPYYPVNDEKNNELYMKYKALADKESNVIFAGRFGTYTFDNMNTALKRAILLAQEVM